ncbi:MAG TPA: hypothetical protein DCY82_08745 [Acidimicrobiaceae bacterium]|nr:hypothetical protein [Acidimicrobiaceae bacterium]
MAIELEIVLGRAHHSEPSVGITERDRNRPSNIVALRDGLVGLPGDVVGCATDVEHAVEQQVCGIELTTSVMPYRFWLMQRLHDDLAAASPDDAARVRSVFADTGLEALLDLRTLRRVERAGHLEVWGPLS